MRLEVLQNVIVYYDMSDVFHILPSKTVTILENKLESLFAAQILINSSSDYLARNPSNPICRSRLTDAVLVKKNVVVELEAIPLDPTNLLNNFKGIEVEEI